MDLKQKIENLSGLHDVNQFLNEIDLSSLSKDDLQLLLQKLAFLNSTIRLQSQFDIVFKEFSSREPWHKFWLPVLISFLALGVSIWALFK
jgi:hypothetical protein